MTLDFFFKNYDLKDAEIKKAEIKNNKLFLEMILVAHLELIANGYRPEMDVDYDDKFELAVDYPDTVLVDPIVTEVSCLDSYIIINGIKIKITDNVVKVLH